MYILPQIKKKYKSPFAQVLTPQLAAQASPVFPMGRFILEVLCPLLQGKHSLCTFTHGTAFIWNSHRTCFACTHLIHPSRVRAPLMKPLLTSLNFYTFLPFIISLTRQLTVWIVCITSYRGHCLRFSLGLPLTCFHISKTENNKWICVYENRCREQPRFCSSLTLTGT